MVITNAALGRLLEFAIQMDSRSDHVGDQDVMTKLTLEFEIKKLLNEKKQFENGEGGATKQQDLSNAEAKLSAMNLVLDSIQDKPMVGQVDFDFALTKVQEKLGSIMLKAVKVGNKDQLRLYMGQMHAAKFLIALSESEDHDKKYFSLKELISKSKKVEYEYRQQGVMGKNQPTKQEMKELRITETVFNALEYLQGLNSVQKSGKVTHGNFNAMLTMLENQIETCAYRAFDLKVPIEDEAPNDVNYALSDVDNLLSINNALIELFQYAKSVDESIHVRVISSKEFQTMVDQLEIQNEKLNDKIKNIGAKKASKSLLQQISDTKTKMLVLRFVQERTKNTKLINQSTIYSSLDFVQTKLFEWVVKALKSGKTQDVRQYISFFKTSQFLISLGEVQKHTKIFSKFKLQSKLYAVEQKLQDLSNDSMSVT